MSLDFLAALALMAVSLASIALALLLAYSAFVLVREGWDGLRDEWRGEAISEGIRRNTRLGPRERFTVHEVHERRGRR